VTFFEFGGAGVLGPWWIFDLIVVKLVNGGLIDKDYRDESEFMMSRER